MEEVLLSKTRIQLICQVEKLWVTYAHMREEDTFLLQVGHAQSFPYLFLSW